MSLIFQILRVSPVVIWQELAPDSQEYRPIPSGLAVPALIGQFSGVRERESQAR